MQFPLSDPLPIKLIAEAVKWRMKEEKEKAKVNL